MKPPPPPLPTIGGPKSLRMRGFKVGFFQNFLGEDPQTPLILSIYIHACYIISLTFGSYDYSTRFSGFLVLSQADP